jgi:hypothetical protein
VWKQSVHRLYEALQNPHVELRVNCYSHVQGYTKCYIGTNFQKPEWTLWTHCTKLHIVEICQVTSATTGGKVCTSEEMCLVCCNVHLQHEILLKLLAMHLQYWLIVHPKRPRFEPVRLTMNHGRPHFYPLLYINLPVSSVLCT